jgi:hypothetical protein
MFELDLCPSCTRPMSWVRQISRHDEDDEPVAQVYECRVCKVILVAAPIPPTPDRHVQ